MDLEIKAFSELDLEDTFFDSLKNSYPEFTDWFQKKVVFHRVCLRRVHSSL